VGLHGMVRSFQRSRFLETPIVLQMFYNAAALIATRMLL
jgi:hypothetical protein